MTDVRGVVYACYPRGVRTGGPEAMHQLVDSLRRQGREAYLVPRPGSEGASRVSAYEHYDAPDAPAVVDAPGNAVVVPEDTPMLLRGVTRAAPFLWWLSVDNSTRFRDERKLLNRAVLGPVAASQRVKSGAAARWHAVQRRLSGETALLGRVHHLAQSEYAWSYLFSRLGVLPSKLTDYTLLDEHVPAAARPDDASIAYNPTKSAELMARMQDRFPEARYVPLQGLSRSELLETLSDTTVYLDLGHHPGKDRLPREAAVCGAVTLVARRGAGAFFEDVPLPAEHKIDPTGDAVGNAIAAVRTVFADPSANRRKQDGYRAVIAAERDAFDAEVRRIFLLGQLGSDR